MIFSPILAESYSVGKVFTYPNTRAFSVRTGQSGSSSLYIGLFLFKHCSTSSKISSNSFTDNKDFPIDL